MKRKPRSPVRQAPRAWLALGGSACLGSLPAWWSAFGDDASAAQGQSSHALLAWLALVAPALGAWVGGSGARLWPFGASVPAAWALALGCCELSSLRAPATPLWAALAWTGLYGLGFGLGAWARERAAAVAWTLLLLSALLCALPGRAGLPGPSTAQRSPALAALLVDLSPASLLFECGGVDWMRHPAVYQPAGTDWFSGTRRPFRGWLAAPLVFVVGCVVCALAAYRRRRRDGGSAAPQLPLLE